MSFRQYQYDAEMAIFNYFMHNNGNPLVAIPTGAGKSHVIANFMKTALKFYPTTRIMALTHVKELIVQNYEKLMLTWPNAPAGIYSAGLRQRDIHFPIIFGGVKSVVNVVEAFGHVDLLLIDECHLLSDKEDGAYTRVIAALRRRNPQLKVIGFTATAWRTGMGFMTNGQIFTDFAYNICDIAGFQMLFREGFLVPPVAKKTDVEYDLTNVSVVNGEFSKGQLNKVTMNEKVTWAALKESLERGRDRTCRLVFCSGIEHAELTAAMLREMGLKAQAVHSQISETARDLYIRQFKSGELDTLTNNGVLTTGFDHPPIDHIIMLRATMSVGLWVQMLGRGTRPYEIAPGWNKRNCLVTDHASNARRLGTIDSPNIPNPKVKTKGDMPIKICPMCGTYNHAAAAECSDCGHPFEKRIGYSKDVYDGPLVASELPQFEVFEVSHVFYTQYLKKNAMPYDKPCIKATYQCGLRQFVEYVHIEASGYMLHRAKEWWKRRFPTESLVPSTVEQAVGMFDKLLPPKAIKVHVNRKYPEIVEHIY